MSWLTPSFIKLSRRGLVRRDVVRRVLATDPRLVRGHRIAVEQAFAFKDNELEFARALSFAHSCLWVYRTNQRAFAGDFVVVNVSSPNPDLRRVFGVELKRGVRLKMNTENALQLRNVPRVLEDIAQTGALTATASERCELLTGDAWQVLEYLGNA